MLGTVCMSQLTLVNLHTLKQKTGRPFLNNLQGAFDKYLITRSKSEAYDKRLCIICQKPCGNIHQIEFESSGENMSSIAEK